MLRYEENTESSPLLALPPEIRNRIFRYVLGDGELIHINAVRCAPEDIVAWPPQRFFNIFSADNLTTDYMKLSHTVCHLEPGSDEELYQRTVRCEDIIDCDSKGKRIQPRRDVYSFRHNRCEQYYLQLNNRLKLDKTDGPLPENRALNLSLLKTCRQVNKEAALMPLAHNSFSFLSASTLDFFISTSLRGRQRATIQRLHFVQGCGGRLQPSTLAQLTGLTQLYVFLRPSGFDHHSWDRSAYLYEPILQLSELRVNDVRVIVHGPRWVLHVGPLGREEAVGWEELLRTGETEYEFKW